MKVIRGKIVEATESELYDYYLTRDWDTVMSFPEYKRKCVEQGTKIIDKESDKVKRRKWKCGNDPIADIGQLIDSITSTGGVWWTQPKGGKFMNASWVWSQQFRYLYEKCRQGVFFYPDKVKGGTPC